MAGFSDYLEAKILDHVFGGTAYSAPATIYIAACTDAPTDASGGTEPSGNNYARVAVTNNTTNFPNASGTTPTLKSNGTIISFPQASGSWGTITHVKLMDASSGGNQLGWSPLSASKAVGSLDTLTIPVGELDITLD